MRRGGPEPLAGPMSVVHRPGMANEMLRELAPLLAEDGIDVDNIDVPDMAALQRALDRALERHNMALFTPVGQARQSALTALRLVAEAIAAEDTALAGAILESVPPEATDGQSATVAGCTGVALDLLDRWLGGPGTDAPAGLRQRTRLPVGHWTGERAATDILALAGKGRAFRTLDTLSARHGGRQMLYGSALAVAAALGCWAELGKTTVPELAHKQLR